MRRSAQRPTPPANLRSLIGANCTVNFYDARRPGTIEDVVGIATTGVNANESLPLSQFKIHLRAGELVTVPGSMLSNIRRSH
jgi:hypothetical protein